MSDIMRSTGISWREIYLHWSNLMFTQQILQKSSILFIMSAQKKISTFFQPLSTNKTTCTSNTLADEPVMKKPKIDTTPEKKGDQENRPEVKANGDLGMSPEQKSRMENSKLDAEMKLTAGKSNGLVINVGPSWFKALKTEFAKPYFEQLGKFVSSERSKYTIYPPPEQVFAWTNTSDIKKVKVVILGQDPYHGPKQAHGLCFSVQQGVKSPPSLENMYKELAKDIPDFKHPGHGELTGWATQGVLLLNACLTVRAANANSHQGKGWEQFTDAVVSWINNNMSGIVFLLWGSYAQKKGARINAKKHHVLKGVHPSPLSAHRGFFGCKHFSKCNELLKSQGKSPIDWGHLPRS